MCGELQCPGCIPAVEEPLCTQVRLFPRCSRTSGCPSRDTPVQQGLTNEQRGCCLRAFRLCLRCAQNPSLPSPWIIYTEMRFSARSRPEHPQLRVLLAKRAEHHHGPTLQPCAAVAFPGRALIPGSRPSAKLLFTPAAGDLIIIS